MDPERETTPPRSFRQAWPLQRPREGGSLSAVGVLSWLVRSWYVGADLPSGGLPREFVLAVPHTSLLITASLFRWTGLVTMASRSRDGELIADVLRRLGINAVRGSSSREGAAALHAMCRLSGVRREQDVPRLLGLTVDGPRGPAWEVKPGVVALAEHTGLPLVPMVARGPGFRARSWDRLQIPYPFARCVARFGTALPAPRRDDREGVRRELQRSLHELGHGLGAPKP